MRVQPELAYERRRRVRREAEDEIKYRIRVLLSNGKLREQEEGSKMEEAFQAVCIHLGRWDGMYARRETALAEVWAGRDGGRRNRFHTVGTVSECGQRHQPRVLSKHIYCTASTVRHLHTCPGRGRALLFAEGADSAEYPSPEHGPHDGMHG